MSTNVYDEGPSRPASIAPTSGATTAPRRPTEPIARRPERRLAGDPRDPPATMAALRARIRSALVRGDTEAEALACARLARHLLALDTHLDEAVATGRRAIALRPDDEALRRHVSEALRSLGEPGLAAAISRPVVDAACTRASRDVRAVDEAVNGLLTLGDLLLRAGDVEGAIESFRYVAVVAPERAEGQERLAIARGIAPTVIPAEVAARAYIGAAKKHQLAGDDARALEALARAFEADPSSPLAANVLADALDELGRLDAADAIRSEHAAALVPNLEAAAVVHATRREKARLRGDRTMVLASVLDELVDIVAHTEPSSAARDANRARIDAALEELPSVLAARRRVHACLATGAEALAAYREVVSRATSDARADALAEVVARDLEDEAALSAMREHARVTRDPTPIVDTLVRALRTAPASIGAPVLGARAAELAGWADEQLDEPHLAAWAWRKLLAVTDEDSDDALSLARRAHDELSRLGPRLAHADARLAEAEREAEDPSRRADGLRKIVRLLAGRPDREDALLASASQLLELQPGDAAALAALDRLGRRIAGEEARRALEIRERGSPESSRRAARVARIEAALRRGDVAAAIHLATSDLGPHVAPYLVAIALRAGSVVELGEAFAILADHEKDRGALLAAAARACRLGGALQRARIHAEEGSRAGPRETRALVELAELAAASEGEVEDDVAGPALERALATVGPRARWALALSAIAERSGEGPLSAAWTRRAWSLRPGDLEVARAWLARAVALQEPEITAEVVRTTTALVASLAPLASELASALRALFVDDARTGEAIARELLAVGAARLAPLRDAILSSPTVTPALVLAVQERWLASGAPAADRASVLLSIGETARRAGDDSRAADAAARALAEASIDVPDRERALSLLDGLAGRTLDPDAELAVRQALAERATREIVQTLDRAPRAHLSPDDDAKLRAAADVLRALGRDLWDLAGDRDAALRAWLTGARYLGAEGLDRLEADIASFGGDDAVRDALFELARREDSIDELPSTIEGASPFARLARVEAFRLRAWERLLEQPPTWVEPLSLAREAAARASDPATLLPGLEQLAQKHHAVDALHDLYEIAAGRTAGRYGARGVHYRAARVLERLGRPEEALTHAVRAFGAVPSEGAMLLMIDRLARASRRADLAISALVEAADQADDPDKKATWLDRASSIAEGDGTPPEERVDLVLRLFLTAPSARSAEALASAIRAAVVVDPTSRETWLQRFVRAHRSVEGQIGWSERPAILSVVARTLAELDSIDPALGFLARGAKDVAHADLDALRTVAEQIAAVDPEGARSWLDRESDGGVLRAHIAWGSGDPDRAIELLAEHAKKRDDLDFGEEDGGARDVECLERWAPSARDKRILAAAWERFGRRHGPAAELEAAKALDEAGQTEQAAQMLVDAWRAREHAGPETRQQIVELARAILPQAGADAALVDLLVDDLQEDADGEPSARIARWREVAEMRAIRLGDRAGALEALVEAGRLAPADDELWNEISELAESMGAHERLAAALAQRLQRARPDKRVALLRKLARVLEHDLGRDAEAAERWAELVRLLPLDAEAADALERIAERRGDGNELLDLLRARAARLPVGHAERTRALRRIARELGGIQGRRGEVLSALREVHQQNPGDVEVVMQLASLARAAGDLGTAAESLMRAFRASTRESSRVQLAIEAARALLELHDHDTASRVLHEAAAGHFENDPRALDLVRLQLEVAIARTDARDEALARIKLAELDVHASAERRAANFASAARALVSLGETARAKELAWKAARGAPGDVAIAALLVELEFGVASGGARRGPSAEDGELLGLLLAISHEASAPAEQLSIVAFARAELLDIARGPGAGYQDLNAWSEEVRARPLVQLALAERLAAEWSFGQAAAAYERAFAGDLHGLRALGPAALAAADAAARSNDSARAKQFLDLAARDPACRIDARRRAVELARAIGDDEGALRALERLAAEATGNVRARALAEQARLLRGRDAEAAAEAMRLAVLAADEGSDLRSDLEREREAIESSRSSRSLPPAPPPSLHDSGITSNRAGDSYERAMAAMMGVPAAEPSPPGAWIAPQSESEPPPEPPPVSARSPAPPPIITLPPAAPVEKGPADIGTHPRLTLVGDADDAAARPRSMPALPRPATMSGALDLETLDKIALDPSAPPAERVRALKTLGEAAHEAGKEDEATRHFISALELGDIAAGDQAAELLALMPGRASDLLLVRRRQVFLAPGDRTLLDALHAAALGVRDLVFARAIDHVRRAFDPVAGPVPPPPLEAQLDRPDLVLPLLERRANPVAAEALRLAWENAQLVFRKEPTALGRNVERVTGTVPAGRVVAAAGRLLASSRTQVYLRARPGRDVEVVLLAPPAVVLGGDCRDDSPDVRYVLGAGLVAALPAHCLLLAQSEGSARSTWQALLSAFGPPEHGRGISQEVGRLAAALWQSIPRAAQRRLGELLGHAPPAFDVALEGARQVARRGGLYLSGDLAAAVRATLAEIGEAQILSSASLDLAAVCAEHPTIADLFRLATSPEFAEARWRASQAMQTRRSPSGGGFPPPSSR